MKFCADGPDIPDDLLWKRDAGGVVFICGAGVSVPGANLPDFPTLALDVMNELRIPDDHNARKVLRLSKRKKNRGLISIDRVFGEIEHDYYMSEIEDTVEKILYSKMKDDKRYHEFMRDLATTPDGKIKLVTTNFDNLFSQVVNAKEWIWPDLPNARQLKSFNGLVYLHGKCSNDDNSEDRKLVLSTSSFGEAYLAGGQAREFLRSMLDNYTVVFVGYSADDPPMQYLLEALAQYGTSEAPAYAFHKGEKSEADRKWRHRGVIPLCYNDHDHLWDTLEHWKNRANDIGLWTKPILEMAQSGPYKLTKWQRSQVAHLVSHPIGAEIVAKSEKPIPPEWLFVFDPEFRYATPKKRAYPGDERTYPDPFDILGLEDDVVPGHISPEDYHTPRKPPNDAWDAFSISLDDARGANNKGYYIPFCKAHISEYALLPERLIYLAAWIKRISKHPITLRWATHQMTFHPAVKRQILHSINMTHQLDMPPIMQRSWETLFEIWDEYELECDAKLSLLDNKVRSQGWNSSRILEYRKLSKPRLIIVNQEKADELFSSVDVTDNIEHITELGIQYYAEEYMFSSSNEYIFDILEADRSSLEKAVEIEKKLKRYNFQNLPIVSKSSFEDLDFPNNFGLSLLFVRYYKRFMDAYGVSVEHCMDEFRTWPESDTNVFARLRILVAGNTGMLTPAKAGDILSNVPQDVFWDPYHRGDIAISIKSRWNEFSPSTIKKIEKRILGGDRRFDGEDDEGYERRRDGYILDMLQWLRDNKCIFNIDYAETIQSLKQKCPTWKESFSKDLDKLEEVTVERGSLDNASLSKGGDMAEFYLLSTIPESERENVDVDDIVEFIGMCEDDPGKAFRLLAARARESDYSEWMWRFWLRSVRSEERCRLFLRRTGLFLCRASSGQIAKMKSSVYDWFNCVVKSFPDPWHDLRYMLSLRLLEALKEHPDSCASEIIRFPGRKIEWVSETVNSPVGHFVAALCKYPDVSGYEVSPDPPRHFLDIATGLLSLDNDGGRFALIAFVIHSPFLYSRFPTWTSMNVFSNAENECAVTREAYCESLAHIAGRIRAREIFMEVRDSIILSFKDHVLMSEHTIRQLSGMIFIGWITQYNGSRLVGDREFCDMLSKGSQDFRDNVLWHFFRWVKKSSDTSIAKCHEAERFFSSVWPLGRFAVSKKTNRYMLEISFTNEYMFSLLIPFIMPRLVRADTFHIELGDLVNKNSRIAKKFPEYLLDILFQSLPNDPINWDYKLRKVFDTIEKSAPHLKKDYRFSSLRRKCIY